MDSISRGRARMRARLLGALLLSLLACRTGAEPRAQGDASVVAGTPSARALVLAPREGSHPLEQRIRVLQKRVVDSKVPARELERLGWTLVALARERGDAGEYRMVLSTALAIEDAAPGSTAALLLRGHALHGLHQFVQAERVARQLVAKRGIPVDYGLLGDVLVDRGELGAAIAAYQRMIDMRPDTHAYARAAHARFLRGDLDGARDAMRLAVRAASPRNAESFAWAWARLALYELSLGALNDARVATERALAVAPGSPVALRVDALIALCDGQHERAVLALERARAHTPHPETLWLLLDTLHMLGRTREAEGVRAQLLSVGASEDPRAFALYLATEGEQLGRAEQLVREELRERHDAYTLEALAWVESAQGRHALALQDARRSLADGTEDARLYYHAGLVAERAGEPALAAAWLARAEKRSATLFPSQQARLVARAR